MRRAALTALLAGLLLAAPALAATPQVTLAQIEPQYMCVTCNIPLVEAESAQADDERQYLASLINRGLTQAEIRRNMVATFGTGVLALPPASGFDLAAYLVPIGVVVVLIAIVALLLPRWRRRRAEGTDRDGPGPPLSVADSARLDADLAHFDG
ncbi:MAG: cytochrome c-type biogenesis protein CcmH [Solirubrobacteraceae bacterium]